jgi:hypothetical protein
MEKIKFDWQQTKSTGTVEPLISHFKISFYIILLLILVSCVKTIEGVENINDHINLKYNLTIDNQNDEINFEFGIWMFKDKKADKNYISNWLNTKFNHLNVLEPINVLWLDFSAKNEKEAIDNVVEFLKLNKFSIRRYSSTGYFGLFENNKWIPQYPETWSDKLDPRTINNHGRVFLAHQISSKLNKPIFISSGAFSIETETHAFISFNKALKQFNEVKEWSLFADNFKVGNIVQTNNYSTFDHNGVKIFILN